VVAEGLLKTKPGATVEAKPYQTKPHKPAAPAREPVADAGSSSGNGKH